MKKIILICLCFIMCISCQSQEGNDLEKVDFSKNYKDILQSESIQTEAREIVTTLPIAFTKDIDQFRFGKVSFSNSKEGSIKNSTVGIIINNTTERRTEGFKIEIEDTSLGDQFLTYLKSQYKTPKIISPVPKKNSEGKILGNSVYLWELNGKTIVFVQYYEYTNNNQNISSVLFLVSNSATTEGTKENVVFRLTKTFTT